MDEVLGSEFAKKRAQVVLQHIAGDLSVDEACQALGIKRSRFYELRTAAAAVFVKTCEPQSAGRPPEEPEVPEAHRVFEARIAQLEEELRLTRAHAELSAFLSLKRGKKN